jgi:hypothetical protein
MAMKFDPSVLPNKDQLQKILIAVGVGIVILVGLYYLVIAPMLADRAAIAVAVDEERQTLEKNRKLIAEEEAVREEYLAKRDQLTNIIETRLAPDDNPVSWVSDIINNAAGRSGASVRSLSGAGTFKESIGKPQGKPDLFETFRAAFELQAGFHDVGRFLAIVEKRVPHAQLVTLTMQSTGIGAETKGLAVRIMHGFARFTEDGAPPETRPSRDEDLGQPEAERKVDSTE